jgi:hypothetical protein
MDTPLTRDDNDDDEVLCVRKAVPCAARHWVEQQ